MERLTCTASCDMLEKIAPSIAAGCVTVISVEAIRDRSGERWARKRDQVAAFVERTFARLSQPSDLLVSVNDVEFVAVQPGAPRFAGLGVSAKTLTETLVFFLGAAAREDVRLFQVTSFADGALGVEPVSATLAMQAGEGLDQDDASRPPPEPGACEAAAPVLTRLDWSTPRRWWLSSPADLMLDLAIAPEPVWNIGAQVVASYRLRPSIWLCSGPDAPRALTCSELPAQRAAEVAMNALSYAAELLGDQGAQVALHAPIPLHALTFSASRYRLLKALRELPESVRRFLVLEIIDVAGGFPPSRLSEVVSMVAVHCRAVLTRAPAETTDIRAWRGCGLSGVALDCGALDPADREAHARLALFAKRAAEGSLACIGYGLPTRSLSLAAWAGGFTHLGGVALADVRASRCVRRLGAPDLFGCKASRSGG